MGCHICFWRVPFCVSRHMCPTGTASCAMPCMYMQKSAWIALPCLALHAESARPLKKERCAVEQMQEPRSLRVERGVGQQGVRRQPLRVQPTPVCEELHGPRRMPLQHSETCPDPALSVAVVPLEAGGGWLKQQGGEYLLLSCFPQRPVRVPFGALYLGQYPIE